MVGWGGPVGWGVVVALSAGWTLQFHKSARGIGTQHASTLQHCGLVFQAAVQVVFDAIHSHRHTVCTVHIVAARCRLVHCPHISIGARPIGNGRSGGCRPCLL